jgi:hypothetical protein
MPKQLDLPPEVARAFDEPLHLPRHANRCVFTRDRLAFFSQNFFRWRQLC